MVRGNFFIVHIIYALECFFMYHATLNTRNYKEKEKMERSSSNCNKIRECKRKNQISFCRERHRINERNISQEYETIFQKKTYHSTT